MNVIGSDQIFIYSPQAILAGQEFSFVAARFYSVLTTSPQSLYPEFLIHSKSILVR